ncbi:MAG: SAM-dependent methyltransferase [Rhodothermales bacterium]|jgi:SAM-dependent methyltransferase
MSTDESPLYWDSIHQPGKGSFQQSLWRVHSDRVNISLLKRWLGDRQFADILKTDLFDEATSPGLFPFLRDRAQSVHGIDLSVETADRAKSRYPGILASCADVRDLPFSDDRFDLIVSNSTLDHFHSKDQITISIRELFRVLKPGGELLITLDNPQNPIVGLRGLLPFRWLKRLHLVPYFVGKTCSRRELTAELEKAGFKVLRTRAILHCPRVLAVPVAGSLQKRASQKSWQRFLSMLKKFEYLAAAPTRFFTGHFVACLALKPGAHPARSPR